MKKLVTMIGILLLIALNAYSLPQDTSSVQVADGVTVYTDNGYYVNARNESSHTYEFSFRYVTEGYTTTYEEWSIYPIYTLVNSIEDVYENVLILPGEQRSLFTAPVSSNSDISYWITITEAYDVKNLMTVEEMINERIEYFRNRGWRY